MAGEDKHVYGFNKQDAAELLQSLGGVGRSPNGLPSQLANGFIVQTPSGGIAKRVSNTVTFVSCAVFYLAGTGSTRTLTSAGFNVPVGNMSSTADVGGSKYILPTMHGGALLANWEDC